MTTHLFISNVWYLQMCDHTHDGDTLTHTVNDTRVQQHTHSMTHTFNDTHIQWHLQRHTQWTTHTFNGTHSQQHTFNGTKIQRHTHSHIQQDTHSTYTQGPLGPSVSESSASLGFALGGRSDASVIPPPLPHRHIREPHPPTTCIFLPLSISRSHTHTYFRLLARTTRMKRRRNCCNPPSDSTQTHSRGTCTHSYARMSPHSTPAPTHDEHLSPSHHRSLSLSRTNTFSFSHARYVSFAFSVSVALSHTHTSHTHVFLLSRTHDTHV